ncbi:hypothetical protein [Salinibacter ruber]|jgi:hypothetical protein|uniref:hypothetical protein n=1 Tax=Salinibacter ruber TaxID=146919 RepID=UPI000C9F6A8E|nr:hypothetical protein [Salinibacter ruber]MBB4091431.1 uncharacterized membrane protein YhaH (DUF805 family) [Salinibacter ruber]MCS3613005.1 uncharacterized membrane protein YhaH (DUF805 family) [Salinibacter ruber]MCS3648244.1 uncharacterized membrane protein YhaH (DUF805 family) [Salinibacter ruber]MCS3785711.1 uncharacterized membrane protein YhaH (DUF805 family) [Salinibacter ruber]
MSWIWWMAIEVSFGLVVMAINLKFRIYERTAATARHLRSEKARVGLRTVLYTVVAAVGMLFLNLEVIARSEAPDAGALVMLVLLLVGAFVLATIQTASEE